jgi:alkanesulfonate monooxygenase SsuD/methylene tetrahydromethanopterin reductase-like flavin-dependent oxidoreductase (luciferase family)
MWSGRTAPPGGEVGPDTLQNIHEPLVLFGHLAAATQHLELVTGVLALPQRQTVLVAKQAAEIDVLSGGRLCLGVGLGWVPAEFEPLT